MSSGRAEFSASARLGPGLPGGDSLLSLVDSPGLRSLQYGIHLVGCFVVNNGTTCEYVFIVIAI